MDQYYEMEAGVDRDHVLNKALYHANRSLSIYPEDEVTQMNLGLLHFNRGEYEMADRRWDLARQYVPDHPTLEKYGIMLSKVFLQQGIEWGRSGQYVKAANLFRKAIKNNPFLWDAYYFLGGALAESNDLQNAMMAWESIRPVVGLVLMKTLSIKSRMIKDYIAIARPDHWFKNVMILPGYLIALMLHDVDWLATLVPLVFGFVAVCLVASSNYVLNDWLDALFDKFHPVKEVDQPYSAH